jgi:hypothetical protein
MRIEVIPLIIGVLVALLGVGILFDAWSPDTSGVATERRRRPRVERHRGGEALIGFGVLALAAAFLARDTWRFSILVVMIGAGFLLLGTFLNRSYLREAYTNRGPLRRRDHPDGDRAEAASNPAEQPAAERAPIADMPAKRTVERAADLARPAKPEREPDGYTGVERRSQPRGRR